MSARELDVIVFGLRRGTPLTHAGVFDLYPSPGFLAPACGGRVESLWVRADDGPDGPRLVELYRCSACLARLPVDLSAGLVLNSYHDPADLVAALAESFGAKRGGRLDPCP